MGVHLWAGWISSGRIERRWRVTFPDISQAHVVAMSTDPYIVHCCSLWSFSPSGSPSLLPSSPPHENQVCHTIPPSRFVHTLRHPRLSFLSKFLHRSNSNSHYKRYRRVYAHRDESELTLHTSATTYLMSAQSSPAQSPILNTRRKSIIPRLATKGTSSDTVAIDYFHATEAGQPRHYTSLQEHSDRTQQEGKVAHDNGATPRQEGRREGFT